MLEIGQSAGKVSKSVMQGHDTPSTTELILKLYHTGVGSWWKLSKFEWA